MKILGLFVCLVLCSDSSWAQESKEDKKRAKQAEAERYAQLNTPPQLILPVSADTAGRIIGQIAQQSGYTLGDYQPGGELFGQATAQTVVYLAPLNWREAFRYTADARFLSFGINALNESGSLIRGMVGVIGRARYNYRYAILLTDPDLRAQLDSVMGQIKDAAAAQAKIMLDKQAESVTAYQQVKPEMSLDDVTKLLGTGKLIEESESANTKIAEYEWEKNSMRIRVVLENGKVVRKSQTGLK